jgi:hypothetical protein
MPPVGRLPGSESRRHLAMYPNGASFGGRSKLAQLSSQQPRPSPKPPGDSESEPRLVTQYPSTQPETRTRRWFGSVKCVRPLSTVVR